MRSESLLESIEATARRRQELEMEVKKLQQGRQRTERDQKEAAEKLSQWKNAWTTAVVDLGLSGEALPAQANAVLSTLDELLKKLDEADGLARRIRGIDRDAAAFAHDVKVLVERIAPDLREMPPDHAVDQLHARLTRAQADAATKIELQKQIKEKEAILEGAQMTIRLMTERLAAFCRQAGCGTPDDLPAAEERSTQVQALRKDLETVEQQLLEQSAGAPLDQLLQEAGTVDVDALPGQLEEIERYRTSHQEPLLARASELFKQLTLCSFSRLQTDFNEQDQPILVGVRPSGDLLGVEGMSDGTRDQLFLALLLASLEHYLATNEPLPFVVDDILIQFDDQRAEATLKVLTQLSSKTQIIFFTHHRGLIEAAQRVAGDGMMTLYRLGLP